jgi:putative membrane protein
MHLVIIILIAIIILFHVYAFVLEAVLWETPRARKVFGTTAATAASSRRLAINQGVYNLFLAAGLGWSLVAADPTGFEAKVFFLGCVVVAAITVGCLVSKRIMLAQGVPALLALILVLANHSA